MRRFALLSASLGVMLALALPATPARALNGVSFVSATGNDTSNNCLFPTTPCQSFPNALQNTVPGGEIICLSGGVFDNGLGFTIAQSVTIDCGGEVVFSLGITINGPGIVPGIVVKLRNFTFNGIDSLGFGINATNMAALFVENCHILGYTGDSGVGINFAPADGVTAKLYVKDIGRQCFDVQRDSARAQAAGPIVGDVKSHLV